MQRPLEREIDWSELHERGWTRLPKLDAAVLARLSEIARGVDDELRRRGAPLEAGFYELWGFPDRALQRDTQPRLAAALGPFLERCARDYRPVLFNLWVKRERDARSVIRFHQDFAFVDERGGQVGVQVWIPLVDVSADNGALILVDGTHVEATPLRALDHKHALAERSLSDLPAGAVQLDLAAGEGVVFTNRTVHGSPPNRGDAPRFAVCALLAPRGAPLSLWHARSPGRLELWSMTDEQLADVQPGEVPSGATFVEAVDVPPATPSAPSSRLDLGDAGSVVFRRLPERVDKVVVTDAGGRFLLVDSKEIDAVERGLGDPREPRRLRLAELGFLRAPVAPVQDDAGLAAIRGVRAIDLSTMTSDACDALVASGDAITVSFDPLPDVHEANRALTGAAPYDVTARWIREIHARFAARGVDPELAYVNAVSTVTRATIAAGPRAVVDAARAFGLVYLELEPRDDDYPAFYREAIRRVVEINAEGALLVDKRLALHLEVLVELARGRRLPTAFSASCAACAYERFCGTNLVEEYTAQGDVATKEYGSTFCRASMGTLDAIFGILASPEGATLRSVFKRWMEARDRVARRR